MGRNSCPVAMKPWAQSYDCSVSSGNRGLLKSRGACVMIASNVKLDDSCVIHHRDLVNLYGCTIGAGTRIGTFVEIQKNVLVGKDCKISSHSFLCEGVTL